MTERTCKTCTCTCKREFAHRYTLGLGLSDDPHVLEVKVAYAAGHGQPAVDVRLPQTVPGHKAPTLTNPAGTEQENASRTCESTVATTHKHMEAQTCLEGTHTTQGNSLNV